MKFKPNFHLLLVLSAASLWGTAGIFVRNLEKTELSEMDMVFGRAFFAALILGIAVIFKDKSLFKIHIKDIWLFIASGLGSIVLFNFSYYTTMSLTSLSVAAVLLYTAPFFVMLISSVLFKKRLTVKKLSALLTAFLGCCLVSGAFESQSRISGKALIFGLLTGLGYALYTIFGELLINRGYKTLTITFYVFLFATVGTVFFIKPSDFLASTTPNSLMWMVLMAFFNTVLPYILYTKGLFGVDATAAPIIATIEPVVATLIGTFIFSEPITFLAVLGIALVLLSVLLLNLKSKRSVTLKAYAKVNLSLGITGKREDGYHFIDTVMQSVSLYDIVKIKKSDRLTLTCSLSHLSGEDNLGFKAAKLFFERTEIKSGAEIYIKKNIPEAGGMGGGSADAAAVLLGLNRLFGTNLSFEALREMASRLGADVPFFLMGGTVRCRGIGEILTPIKALNKGYFVIAKTGVKPSTGEMYKRIDSEPETEIPVDTAVNFIEAEDLKGLSSVMDNSFSRIWADNPLLNLLKELSPLGACLSGSGPTCFGVFETRKEAKKCIAALKTQNIKGYLATPKTQAIEFLGTE